MMESLGVMLDQSVPKALTQPQAAAAPTAPSCSPCSPRLPQAPAPEGCPDTGLVASPGLVLQEHREPEHSRTPRVLSGGDRRGCKGRVLVVPRGRRGSPPRSQPWGGRDPGGSSRGDQGQGAGSVLPTPQHQQYRGTTPTLHSGPWSRGSSTRTQEVSKPQALPSESTHMPAPS